MKKALLLTPLLLFTLFAQAQKPLTNSRTSSVYTYIYRLDDANTCLFLSGKQDLIKNESLTSEVAKYLTDHPENIQLPAGNYLKVYAEKNTLKYKLIQKHNADLIMLSNRSDLRFILVDDGEAVPNAEVYRGNKQLVYDKQAETYHIGRSKKDTLIKAVYKGVSNFYNLYERTYSIYNDYYGDKKLSKNKLIRWWQKTTWKIASLFRKPVSRRPPPIQTNPGFIVFNKPKYKPDDTVKFKAFILQKKSMRPVNDTRLAVRLKEYYGENGKIIGYVDAYRKGGFDYQFKLNKDSLQLRLDRQYIISLETLDSKKYDTENYDGDRPDWEILHKRTVYQEAAFRFEDYQLKTNRFNVRVDRTDGSPGLPTMVYFKATDDNDLNIPDGRVKMEFRTDQVKDYGDKSVFIPNLLWEHEMLLDPVGETKFTIPDSIFVNASLSCRATFTLLNSNNENVKKDNFYLRWDYHTKIIDTKIEHDTLKIKYTLAGKSIPAKALLFKINSKQDTTAAIPINLPADIVIGADVANCIIKVDSLVKEVRINNSDPNFGGLQTLSYRTKDSLFIKVSNPRNAKFWYTIYKGKKAFDMGTATQLNYKKPFKYSGGASILINTVWADRSVSKEDAIPVLDHFLSIDVQQPASVYPGQQANVEVKVKDKEGKPVADADITAYSITRKFEDAPAPVPPYLGETFKSRPVKPELFFKPLRDTGQIKLNWQYWSKSMGLDTITYYKFTHTDSVYKIAEPAPGNITQVAPFIVNNGEIVPVHILYIDDKPVYFSQSQDLQRYSFPVDIGIHSIFFRTANNTIRLNNVNVPAGKKLILGINVNDKTNKDLFVWKMPDTLVNYESNLINKYLVSIVPNFNQYMATLTQGNKVALINQGERFYYYNPNNNGLQQNIVAGPFDGANIDLTIKGGFKRTFPSEGGYSYEFHPDLIKQKSLYVKYPFNTKLKSLTGNSNYRQYPLTLAQTDTIWRNFLDERARFSYKPFGYSSTGRLIYKINDKVNGKEPIVKNVFIYKKDIPDYLAIYPGRYTKIYGMEAGTYRLLFLLKDNSYYLLENVVINLGGINFYNTGTLKPHPADSVSLKIAKATAVPDIGYIDRKATNEIKEAFNQKFLDMSLYKGDVLGYVYDAATGEPLTGTTIGMDGKGITQADINGYFKVHFPKAGKLTFTNVGYASQEIKTEPGKIITVKLIADQRSLNDVVIRGYSPSVNQQVTTGSSYIVTPDGYLRTVSSLNVEQLLQGKVAGLNIQNNTGAPSSTVNIRGLSTLSGGSDPLYVVDGVKIKLNGKDFAIPAPDMIASKTILTADAAMAIYGPEAVNGAVIIVTKRAANEQPAQTLRRNFSDYAYWLPRLKTDANGQLQFKVTYPDDITSWRTFIIGATDKRQSGFSEGLVKSFKPVSANFVSPQFAVKGDNFSVLGKTLNYTTDTLLLNRKFSYNGKTIADDNITLQNARIDTFKLVAAGTDTLSFEYAIKRRDGYFDGEHHTIPVFEQGSLETRGSFDVLEKDTTITIQTNPGLKEATLRAEASVFPALLDETEHLRNYEYLCNEQLASKLKALLAEKQIRAYLKQPFKWDGEIKDIIKKLMESRNNNLTWGWWDGTEEELWITDHAIEALMTAESLGYKVGSLSKIQLVNYLVARLTLYNGPDKLSVIASLKTIDPNINLQAYVADYEKNLPAKTLLTDIEKYRLMYARQLAGMPIAMDSLLKNMKRTMFGNIYWGDKSYNFFNNSIQQSLLAYRILKAEGKHNTLLPKLRNYFMEQRSDGHWRNTYESAEILETILPDMLVGGQQSKPAALKLNGDKNETVTQFPYTTTLSAGTKLTVSKTGDMPVYLTAYQKFWNPEPKKVSGDFTVNTRFNKGETQVTKAKGGEAITLTAEVIVKADADFVMIEIPIPAGCSYDSKDQGYYGGEVHREYFKNKVSIFCRKLTVGTYKYIIKLMPRYSGNYHLNPAKAEMMYFPVFYGRERMKMFGIE